MGAQGEFASARAAALFRGIEASAVDDCLRRASRRAFEPGERAYSQGERGRSFFLVASGRFRMSISLPNGSELILRYLSTADTFGEVSLFDCRPRSASVAAAEKSVAHVLSPDELYALVQCRPQAMKNLLGIMSEHIQELNARLEDIATLDAGARLAKGLLGLLGFSSRAEPIRVPQRELGELVGASREVVNRILRRWSARGLIAREGHAILVNDRKSLAEIGKERPVATTSHH